MWLGGVCGHAHLEMPWLVPRIARTLRIGMRGSNDIRPGSRGNSRCHCNFHSPISLQRICFVMCHACFAFSISAVFVPCRRYFRNRLCSRIPAATVLATASAGRYDHVTPLAFGVTNVIDPPVTSWHLNASCTLAVCCAGRRKKRCCQICSAWWKSRCSRRTRRNLQIKNQCRLENTHQQILS